MHGDAEIVFVLGGLPVNQKAFSLSCEGIQSSFTYSFNLKLCEAEEIVPKCIRIMPCSIISRVYVS